MVRPLHRDRVAEEEPAVRGSPARVLHVEVERRVVVLGRPVTGRDVEPDPSVARQAYEVLVRVVTVARDARERDPAGGGCSGASTRGIRLELIVPQAVVGGFRDDGVVVRRGQRIVVPGDEHALALGGGHAREVVGDPPRDRSSPDGRVVGVVRVPGRVDLRRGEDRDATADQLRRRARRG